MVRSRLGSPAQLLLLATLLEIAIFAWICATHEPARTALITSGDTWTYVTVAKHLAAFEPPGPSHRTLGYPVFLALCFLLSAGRAPLLVAIALQLALNLALTASVWRFLTRFAGGVRPSLRMVTACVVFVAGLDLALLVLTDFLAAAAFFGFAMAVLLRRDRRGLAQGAAFLAIATVMRPSFTLLPIFLVASIPLIARATLPLPLAHAAVYVLVSLASTGVSIAYQRAYLGYLGPSDVIAYNLRLTIFNVQEAAHLRMEDFDARFREALEGEAGRSDNDIGPNERDALTARLLRREIRAHPEAFGKVFVTSLAKYTLAPFEGTFARLAALAGNPGELNRPFRASLTLAGLPFFLLGLAPLPVMSASQRGYSIFSTLWFAYFVCLAVVAPAQGERMRLPAIPLLGPVFAWNAEHFMVWIERVRSRTTSSIT